VGESAKVAPITDVYFGLVCGYIFGTNCCRRFSPHHPARSLCLKATHSRHSYPAASTLRACAMRSLGCGVTSVCCCQQQIFIQFLAATQPAEFYFNVFLFQGRTNVSNHAPDQQFLPARHIQHKISPPCPIKPACNTNCGGLRDRHEVTGDVRIASPESARHFAILLAANLGITLPVRPTHAEAHHPERLPLSCPCKFCTYPSRLNV